MKKTIIFTILCIFIFSIASAEPNVSREMPNQVEENELFQIVLKIETNSVEKIDIAEMVPMELEIISWEINPEVEVSFENRKIEFLNKDYNSNHWGFESIPKEFEIIYIVSANKIGNYEFQTLYLYPYEFDSFSSKLEVVEAAEESKIVNTASPLTGMIIGTEVVIEETEEAISNDLNNRLSNLKNSIDSIIY